MKLSELNVVTMQEIAGLVYFIPLSEDFSMRPRQKSRVNPPHLTQAPRMQSIESRHHIVENEELDDLLQAAQGQEIHDDDAQADAMDIDEQDLGIAEDVDDSQVNAVKKFAVKMLTPNPQFADEDDETSIA
jgi:hypothetical protein